MSEWVRPEYQLLIAAAAVDRRCSPDTSNLDWDEVFRLAAQHRLEGLLHAHLYRAEIAAPEEVSERLHDRRRRFALAEMAARVQVGQLGTTLLSAGIKAVPLKGAALVGSAYSDAGLRPLGDIDLLIGPDALGAALEALSAAGYEERTPLPAQRAGAQIREHHHHAPLRHPTHPFAVELHLRPTLSGRSEATSMLAGAQPSPAGDGLRPDPSDHLVVLAAHFITDREVGSFAALGQLADIARVVAEARLDRVADRAAGWDLSWESFAALDAVRALGLCQLPGAGLAALKPASWNPRTTSALLRHRVLTDSAMSMTPRRSSYGLRGSLIPDRRYLQARYGSQGDAATRLYTVHARMLARRARPLVVSALRHPRRSAAEIILSRRLRAK